MLRILFLSTLAGATAGQDPGMTPEVVERFARLALDCVEREYPNKVAHVLASDDDVRPPRALTPVFYGCFDWHSAVHGHWLLVRLARLFPDAAAAAPARAVLDRHLTRPRVAAEVAYMVAEGRTSWERPYGLAWLLQLAAELREWDDSQARQWSQALEPLEAEVARRMVEWLPKLSHPIRTGEHSQSAFAMGLMLDWARGAGETEAERLVVARAIEFHGDDEGWPLRFEPGGQDFLSPGLAVADLMRRVYEPEEFARWLSRALPDIRADAGDGWLPPAVVTDKADGKLAHLDGLNLSRAWMLEGIAAGLPEGDARRPVVLASAAAHREAGIASVTGEHYAGGHWLGSFATYLVTRRGL